MVLGDMGLSEWWVSVLLRIFVEYWCWMGIWSGEGRFAVFNVCWTVLLLDTCCSCRMGCCG